MSNKLSKLTDSDIKDEKSATWALWALSWGIPALLAAAVAAYATVGFWVLESIGLWGPGPLEHPSTVWGDWGPVGDFVGGILNPALTFLTFIGVLLTIKLQAYELSETRREARQSRLALEGQLEAANRQNFESAFFQMLSLQTEIVKEISHGSGVNRVEGSAAFEKFHSDLMSHIDHNVSLGNERTNAILKAEESFWPGAHQQMGHYFRYLYNILRYIDTAEIEHKIRYIKILRAQISDYELLMLMYNTMSHRGFNYRYYIRTYDLLDNLPRDVRNCEQDEIILEDLMDSKMNERPKAI